ncbi:hypothetical protein E2C01_101885 [Portunus trituberculatus]|uniref:Uncharacterized protein n=1 Tax=Portunus trituberculatus TaxID=210409 RepID=A0A5B7KL46_PORTR|nr:hypothetical protein [Portunus trituberculatus]
MNSAPLCINGCENRRSSLTSVLVKLLCALPCCATSATAPPSSTSSSPLLHACPTHYTLSALPSPISPLPSPSLSLRPAVLDANTPTSFFFLDSFPPPSSYTLLSSVY